MYLLAQLVLLLHLSYTDIRYRRIPNISLLIFLLLSIFLSRSNVLVASTLFFLVLLLRGLSGNQIGMGDAKLIFAFGLGSSSINSALRALWLACFIALFGVLLYRIFNGKWRYSIAFAPYICLGFIISR